MGIKSELHEAILKRGGKVPPYGGIAAAMDELNKLPGGGGVSSWNDLTDKPFGTEMGEILPETVVEFSENGEGAIANVVPVVTGNTYKVYWNGTEYTCVAGSFDMEGIPFVAIGNIGVMTGEGVTDEPFLLLVFPPDIAAEMGAGVSFLALDGSTSATVSIGGEVVNPLDAKYLPSEVVRRMVVKFTTEDGNNVSADKTFEEVKAAYSGGYDVVGVYITNDETGTSEYWMPLVSHTAGRDGTGAEYEAFTLSALAGVTKGTASGVSIMFTNSAIVLTQTMVG